MSRIDHFNLSAVTKPRKPTASDMANDIFQGTQVESIYDGRGEFSHLLATLPREDFLRLYGALATANVFIEGYWFELCLKNTKKSIINRETKMQLRLDVFADELGRTTLSFYRYDKCVAKFKFKRRTVKELLCSEDGYFMIARAATQVFNSSQETFLVKKDTNYPTVIVVAAPEPVSPAQGRRLMLVQ